MENLSSNRGLAINIIDFFLKIYNIYWIICAKLIYKPYRFYFKNGSMFHPRAVFNEAFTPVSHRRYISDFPDFG
ncbi:hypothetical protein SAMN05660206_104214 [Sphingobacterium wenxiniae]|uniref:Uncharacterized protein n=1 Tax=Sphingobacterium wenxiniae TaxID=683125 RepID=A0A1I6SCF3_9SPHI|nr:hypothetical protein SAMN05660206_104214 [Sphingobacterium wenxiniae]